MSQRDLCKTNLGKWGRGTTQTYEEHTYATWVFRRPLLALVHALLKRHLPEAADALWQNYLEIAKLETEEHDYDKLYVPVDMLTDLSRFAWHGDPSHPANQAALTRRLVDLRDRILKLLFAEATVSDVLRAANFSHEGPLIPSKINATRDALGKFFKELDFPLDSTLLSTLTKIHVRTLRAADAIASARSDPAFKDDVSALANDVAELLPDACLRVVVICFDTAFANASSLTVLAGYYRLYHAAFLGLREILEPGGLVVADNARTLVGLVLTADSQESLEQDLWQAIRKELDLTDDAQSSLASVFALSSVAIDLSGDPLTFDADLRTTLMNALGASYMGIADQRGLPCATCGRNTVQVAPSDLPKALGDEVVSLEKRGDFGFYNQVRRPLYGLERGGVRGKSDKAICSVCIGLARLSKERSAHATLVLAGIDSKYEQMEAVVRLTGPEANPLARMLYSFTLQQQILSDLQQQANLPPEDSQLIAASGVRIRFTPDIRGLLTQVISPVRNAVSTRTFPLPDGQIVFQPDYGLRIGAGALLLGGNVHDTTYLNGVYPLDHYGSSLSDAVRIEALLAQLGDQKAIDSCLVRLGLRRGHTAIIREAVTSAGESLEKLVQQTQRAIRSDRRADQPASGLPALPEGIVSLGTIAGMTELANALVSNPEALIVLRQVREASKRDVKVVGEGEE